MKTSGQNYSEQDPLLLKILSGEETPAALPSAVERSRAEAALKMLQAAFVPPPAPPLPCEKLETELRKLDQAPPPATVSILPGISMILVGAALLGALALGYVFTSTRTIQNVPPIQRTATHPSQRLPDGRWRVAGSALIRPLGEAQLSGADSLLLLHEGRVDIESDGDSQVYEPVLKAGRQLQLSARGVSQSALRVTATHIGFSVFAGDSDCSQLSDAQGTTLFRGGGNQDVLVRFKGAAGAAEVILWPDVTAPLPPVTTGEIYLRLKNDRVLRGVVTRSAPDGILLNATAAATSKFSAPESVLFAEIAGWVPAQTPRGRDAYARWLSELLPAQLKDAALRWSYYVAAREVGAEHSSQPLIIDEEQRFPEVKYQVRGEPGELIFQATPQGGDLGPAWCIDSQRKISSEQARGGSEGF